MVMRTPTPTGCLAPPTPPHGVNSDHGSYLIASKYLAVLRDEYVSSAVYVELSQFIEVLYTSVVDKDQPTLRKKDRTGLSLTERNILKLSGRQKRNQEQFAKDKFEQPVRVVAHDCHDLPTQVAEGAFEVAHHILHYTHST